MTGMIKTLDQSSAKVLEPMSMQVSSLNTAWLIECLRQHYPEVNLVELLHEATSRKNYSIRNLKTGQIEPVALFHLESPDYWFSNQFMVALYYAIEKFVPDPLFAYQCGRTYYQTQSCLKTAVGVPLIGLHGLFQRMVRENHKYNRTKDVVIRQLEKGRVVIRLIHKPNIIMTDFAMKWHLGIFESYGRLAGIKNMQTSFHCVEQGPFIYGDPGQAIYDFDIRYDQTGVFKRFWNRLLYAIPTVKETLDKAEEIQAEHNEQLLNRDRIIEQRTKHLVQIQSNLMTAERKVIENRLRTLSAELIETEERERRAIAEDLHDSTTQLLALSVMGLRRHVNGQSKPEELNEVLSHMQDALTGLRSLTFQISPPVLYDFGLESALEWLAEDISEHQSLKLEYRNTVGTQLKLTDKEAIILYRTVREAVINCIKHAKASHACIIIYKENRGLKIKIEDNGIGFNAKKIKKGFGLSTAADRLAAINCDIDVVSKPKAGTEIILSVGEKKLN